MPFGISSAPEVFQRRMHELIEGLWGLHPEGHRVGVGSATTRLVEEGGSQHPFSNFIEVESIPSVTTQGVCKVLR